MFYYMAFKWNSTIFNLKSRSRFLTYKHFLNINSNFAMSQHHVIFILSLPSILAKSQTLSFQISPEDIKVKLLSKSRNIIVWIKRNGNSFVGKVFGVGEAFLLSYTENISFSHCTYIHKMAMNRKTHTQTIQEMSQVPGLSYNLIPWKICMKNMPIVRLHLSFVNQMYACCVYVSVLYLYIWYYTQVLCDIQLKSHAATFTNTKINLRLITKRLLCIWH